MTPRRLGLLGTHDGVSAAWKTPRLRGRRTAPLSQHVLVLGARLHRGAWCQSNPCDRAGGLWGYSCSFHGRLSAAKAESPRPPACSRCALPFPWSCPVSPHLLHPAGLPPPLHLSRLRPLHLSCLPPLHLSCDREAGGAGDTRREDLPAKPGRAEPLHSPGRSGLLKYLPPVSRRQTPPLGAVISLSDKGRHVTLCVLVCTPIRERDEGEPGCSCFVPPSAWHIPPPGTLHLCTR